MPNQKISELTAIVTVDNSVDVLPIVDISANTTKKVTPNALKTALALDNVNNTSDANKPVSIAQQDALNAKVDENAPIVAATKTKITYDAKGLVTAGDILDAADMPTGINAANIGTGVVSSTEFGYLDGVTSAIQTQLNAKQATLVSGTNIKTINGATVLGAGDITIAGNPPSGVAGAIQFSNGSAFASDASNLFWDDTNNRLGVGTNSPSATTHFKGSGSTSATTSLLVQNSAGASSLQVTDDGSVYNLGKGAVTSNSAFGRLALNTNTSGTNNTANGAQSLQNNTTGSANTADGVSALASNLTGSNNTAIGRSTLTFMTAGSANTAVGAVALYSTTASNNTAVGYEAGFNNTTGANNSLLGQGTITGNFSGSVILGKDATATASNQFVVGSTGTNAGSVVTESNSSTKVWNVIINGVAQKILLA
jgi:hypothetical protein